MDSAKKTARFAGLLYLIWIVTGLYSLFYVPSQINMRDDAVTVAQNILSNEFLFRISIMNNVVNSSIWVFLVLVLYRLFKSVNGRQAKLLVALVLVQIPAVIIVEVFNVTSLMILKGEVLKTFELGQRQDLALLFLRMTDYGVLALELYWGLWLLPLGVLAYRSSFLPRFLGVWLIINGCALVVLSFTAVLLPEYKDTVFTIPVPAMLGEVAFMLWLLIIGAKPKPLDDTFSAPG
ncbi:MAG TPA: DUF4386 domain-containing protein [Bacteroidetes bacterium]|nr:DUF4386 domain-containing protein [Bacteroidota bacterium]